MMCPLISLQARHTLGEMKQSQHAELRQRSHVHAAGARDHHPLELLLGQPGRLDLFARPSRGSLHPAQPRVASHHRSQARRRVTREAKEHLGAPEQLLPAALCVGVASEPLSALMIAGVTNRRQQVRLVGHLDPVCDRTDRLHQLRVDRRDNRDREHVIRALRHRQTPWRQGGS